MGTLARKRREEAIAHAEGHADPVVQEAVQALLQEIVVLRGMVGDGPPRLTLSRRRLVGRIVATFVLAAGLALAALMAMNDRNALAFREGVAEGYRAGHPAVESVSAPVARPSGQESARR